LSSPLETTSPLSVSTQVGLLLSQLTGAPGVAVAQMLGGLLVVGCALLALLRPARVSPTSVIAAGAFISAAAVLFSPVVHFWYFFWCLPLLAVSPLAPRGRCALIAVTFAFGLLAPFDASQNLPDAATWEVVGLLLALSVGISRRGPALD